MEHWMNLYPSPNAWKNKFHNFVRGDLNAFAYIEVASTAEKDFSFKTSKCILE